uniref:Rugosauperolein-2 n=1 Tax=Uperoleia rugosa TaxID=8368 RepID=TKN2_UPERU|nr:RecName: Full=Rugosauperolein-2; AltName: Full=Rugosauperolein II; AltName: Full=[Lys5,Thr6]-physalaemin [Uperoleia rugosa]
QADPKTFYGLM